MRELCCSVVSAVVSRSLYVFLVFAFGVVGATLGLMVGAVIGWRNNKLIEGVIMGALSGGAFSYKLIIATFDYLLSDDRKEIDFFVYLAEATMSTQAVKKSVEENQKLAIECTNLVNHVKKLEHQCSLYDHERVVLMDFGYEADKRAKEAELRVQDLEERLGELTKELELYKNHAEGQQGDGGDHMPHSSAAAQSLERQDSHNGKKVYKSGPLFLSSKRIGWTSWKKRWFILTETSLVFFRSDPNAAPQKGGEANLTLGGIDLKSSGSVLVKADKKLLTVLFPDGRDGRAFTLKATTSEDLFEWKEALEAALSNAPSAGNGLGQNGVSKSEKGDTADGSQEQSKDQSPRKSTVLGRPVLHALEDIDGTPLFLEKALCYVEDFGVNVEGILRQAADVDDVERRIREYEEGKTEFTNDEDRHVIGDCIKYVLRELPSPLVPASCCAALLEAYRSDRATRVSDMRAAICDTFPEPNRRLLQRILIMMEAVAENKSVNRMSVSAVAACMSPLVLRPLLSGEVDLGKGPDMGGDGSAQLLQAAAAANHAQAIIITLVEEYDKLFGVSTLEDVLQNVPVSTSTDEKANADLVEIDLSQGHDSALQPNQPCGQSSNKPGLQQAEKDHESATISNRNKETHSSKHHGNKHHLHALPSKHHERSMSKSTSSRRVHPKGEAANTTSALSKIINRLNSSKER